LAELLEPYADGQQVGRVVDVAPSVAAEALRLLPPDLTQARLNLHQPPMVELVMLAEQLGGRLVGAVQVGRLFVRFDGVQVAAASARELAVRIATAWPARGEEPGALESALAEGWSDWSATDASWVGGGADLLTSSRPASVEVVGVWWD
jgi:hypothetical protein